MFSRTPGCVNETVFFDELLLILESLVDNFDALVLMKAV